MKKVIVLSLTILITFHLLAQNKTINIRGTVKDTTVKSVQIGYLTDAAVFNWDNIVVEVENGAFKTSIQTPYLAPVNIQYGDRYYSKYIDDNTSILIDNTGDIYVTGSAMQDEYENKFLPFFKTNDSVFESALDLQRSAFEKYGDNLPKSITDSLTILKERYLSQRFILFRNYIELNPDSYVALWNVYEQLRDPVREYFDFEKLFGSFSAQMQQLPLMQTLRQKLANVKRLDVGNIFPGEFFEGHGQIQNGIRKNSKYYLIDFWYSDCSPCIAGFPRLKEIYNKFHSKGFDIVRISKDKKKDEADYLAAIKKHQLTWHHIWDKDGVTTAKFGIESFPTYILLDKNGKIIKYFILFNQLEEFLEENL